MEPTSFLSHPIFKQVYHNTYEANCYLLASDVLYYICSKKKMENGMTVLTVIGTKFGYSYNKGRISYFKITKSGIIVDISEDESNIITISNKLGKFLLENLTYDEFMVCFSHAASTFDVLGIENFQFLKYVLYICCEYIARQSAPSKTVSKILRECSITNILHRNKKERVVQLKNGDIWKIKKLDMVSKKESRRRRIEYKQTHSTFDCFPRKRYKYKFIELIKRGGDDSEFLYNKIENLRKKRKIIFFFLKNILDKDSKNFVFNFLKENNITFNDDFLECLPLKDAFLKALDVPLGIRLYSNEMGMSQCIFEHTIQEYDYFIKNLRHVSVE